MRENFPSYDLAVHFLAINNVLVRGQNPLFLEIFKLGLEMLHYNANQEALRAEESREFSPQGVTRELFELVREIQSPISVLDPYAELHKLIHN